MNGVIVDGTEQDVQLPESRTSITAMDSDPDWTDDEGEDQGEDGHAIEEESDGEESTSHSGAQNGDETRVLGSNPSAATTSSTPGSTSVFKARGINDALACWNVISKFSFSKTQRLFEKASPVIWHLLSRFMQPKPRAHALKRTYRPTNVVSVLINTYEMIYQVPLYDRSA